MTESWPSPQFSLLDWLRVAERAADGPFALPQDMRARAVADRSALDTLVGNTRCAVAKRRNRFLAETVVKDAALVRLGAHLAELRALGRACKDRETL